MRQIAAGAEGLAARACLARRLTRLARFALIDPDVRVWAHFHALVAQEVQSKVALKALLARELALFAAGLTLGAHAVDLKVATGALTYASAVEEEGKLATGSCVAGEAFARLAGGTLPAWPVASSRDRHPGEQLVDQIKAPVCHSQCCECTGRLGDVAV